MRKLASIFVILISFSLVFAGAVSAQEDDSSPSVDVVVTDENGDPVDVASPGDNVTVGVTAKSGLNTANPAVVLYINPKTSLEFDQKNVVMFFGGKEYKNDPLDPYFSFEGFDSNNQAVYVWDIGSVIGDFHPGQQAQLLAPAIVKETGMITVTTDFFERSTEIQDPRLLDSDNYTFQSVENEATNNGKVTVNSETVPMQNTGVPLALAVLSLLSIIGGTIYSKIR